jgi:4-alpha-glucanotransferase
MFFWKMIQYFFFRQWRELKAYANEKGISIIGDIPFYVAYDGADVWANPWYFAMDADGKPVEVAGCPPDAFSADGQLWGNPIYNWKYLKKTKYEWWIRRIANTFELVDTLRVDHFRAFDEFYEIPFGDETARNGKWVKGPGLGLFREMKKQLGELHIIAEDLGYITPSVRKLLKDSGFPGMKVLQFAFDSREESDYLPHNYGTNCVVYTGTHDNETMRGWCKLVSRGDYGFAKRYLGYVPPKTPEVAFIRSAMASVADTCVIPIQDYLGLGHEACINTPSTLGDNWMWRLQPGQLTPELAEEIRRMTKLYGRL